MPRSKLQISDLVDAFALAAHAQEMARERHDMHAQNKWADRARKAADALRAFGRPGEAALIAVMHHGEPTVRDWAAQCVLEFEPETAVPVLEELLIWAKNQPPNREAVGGPALPIIVNSKILLSRHYGMKIHEVEDYVKKKLRKAGSSPS